MNCRTYIDLLTSGRLQDADLAQRNAARLHRLLCRYCRTFTRNDATLDQMLAAYRQNLHTPATDSDHDSTPPSQP